MSRTLRHLAWSDDRFYAALAQLPDEAFAARYSQQAWTVGTLAGHIVGGAEWYRYCLTGQKWTEFDDPTSAAEVQAMGESLLALDAGFIEQAGLPDDLLTFEDEEGPAQAHRSVLLSQAVLHAAEHKAQICAALDACGFTPPSLDDLDVWAFAVYERSLE